MPDGGHTLLINDLRTLLFEAETYEFHDFKNKKYATPKVELYSKLILVAKNVRDGRYDNQ